MTHKLQGSTFAIFAAEDGSLCCIIEQRQEFKDALNSATIPHFHSLRLAEWREICSRALLSEKIPEKNGTKAGQN